uniref:Uncharacterized protein n=1 Tax=Avena sativa TaxID=4498 RepID=A0ACD5TFC2_AVESA
MDQRKALFRAKLREAKEKQEKRIDPSLVRYNEYDQPICRVCNVTLKSEALWPAHQVSRKHHEAKAAAATKVTEGAAPRGKNVNHERPAEPAQKAKSSSLPANFFDSQGVKRQNDGTGSEGRSVRHEVAGVQSSTKEPSVNKPSAMPDQVSNKGIQGKPNVKGILPGNFFDYTEEDEDEAPAPAPKEPSRTPGNIANPTRMHVKGVPAGFFDSSNTQPTEASASSQAANNVETAQVKGALPEGFFDNKDADLRARGIEPPKVDINDAYKEFEKEIQENLQEVDDRLEEEEIDAAAEREEYLTLEQEEYRQRVDMLKKQLTESKATRNAKANSKPVGMDTESSASDSSSDDEDGNTDFAVDWRAQHMK